MPCMGPSEPEENQVNKITDQILSKMLKENDLWTMDTSKHPPGFEEGREKSRNKLKEAIKEILWQDNCESF